MRAYFIFIPLKILFANITQQARTKSSEQFCSLLNVFSSFYFVFATVSAATIFKQWKLNTVYLICFHSYILLPYNVEEICNQPLIPQTAYPCSSGKFENPKFTLQIINAMKFRIFHLSPHSPSTHTHTHIFFWLLHIYDIVSVSISDVIWTMRYKWDFARAILISTGSIVHAVAHFSFSFFLDGVIEKSYALFE